MIKNKFVWTLFRAFSVGLFFTVPLNVSLSSQIIRTPLAGTPSFPAEEYNEWLKVQVDSSVKDADKVACTINTFFNLKYKSWMKLELLDFGFLFDLKNATAKEDYTYERGLFNLMLVAWREFNTPPNSLESYKYEPKYSLLSVDKDKAKVRMNPYGTIVHTDKSSDGTTPWQEHTFTLVHKNDLWLIRSVLSSDEMRDVYPHGTNFNKALKSEREYFQKEQIKEEAEFAILMKDPRMQQHILRKKIRSHIQRAYIVTVVKEIYLRVFPGLALCVPH
jgi:hypothetical protein